METTPVYYKCNICKYLKVRKEFYEKEGSRGVRAECKACYKLNRLNEKHTTVCSGCSLPQKVATNGFCGKCNTAKGLKECKKCLTVYGAFLAFYNGKAVCRWCMSKDQGKPRGRKSIVDDTFISKVKEMVENGLTKETIAEKLSCSVSTIHRLISKHLGDQVRTSELD